MWRLKSNYLWETGPEEGARPLAKWFTLRAILFYRLLNSLDHSKICMYYSAFERKNCCPARLPSAFWTLWCIWGMLPFRIRLKSYFSAWGQMKWVGKKEGAFLASLPRTFHHPSLQRRLSSAKYTHTHIYQRGNCMSMSRCTRIGRKRQKKLRFSCEGKELSPVWEIIQEHLVESRCRDGMCEACGAKRQQVQGERTLTSPGAGDLQDNSYPLLLGRRLFRVEQNCALQTLYILSEQFKILNGSDCDCSQQIY